MSLWQKPVTVEALNALAANTAIAHLGIEFTEVGADFISARMPVDARTHQPMGLLHGGASVLLAETLGSCGAMGAAAPGHHVVGLDINANHVRSARTGWVTGTTRPVHIGRTTQVWSIEIVGEGGELVCVSRITMAAVSYTHLTLPTIYSV